jgi:hypothetical protein
MSASTLIAPADRSAESFSARNRSQSILSLCASESSLRFPTLCNCSLVGLILGRKQLSRVFRVDKLLMRLLPSHIGISFILLDKYKPPGAGAATGAGGKAGFPAGTAAEAAGREAGAPAGTAGGGMGAGASAD